MKMEEYLRVVESYVASCKLNLRDGEYGVQLGAQLVQKIQSDK